MTYPIGEGAPKDLGLYGPGIRDVAREQETRGPREAEFNFEKNRDGYLESAPDLLDIEKFMKEVQDKSRHSGPGDEMPPAGSDKKTISVTVMHTNDLHGNLLPTRKAADPATPDDSPEMGGSAHIASITGREREKAEQDGGHFLLVDAGDIAMGTPLSGLFMGKSVIDVMNSQKYDAAAIGNHDFDWGKEPLVNMIQRADFPFVSANIQDENGLPMPHVEPFVIKDLGDMKVGIAGVITNEAGEISSQDEVRSMKFADPVTSLKETIPLMKKQGAGMVILLSHSGLSKDIEIAQNVKGIDLIVGGHTHDTLETPVRVGDTTIVQAGCDGAKVGKVVMEWDPESQKAVSARGQLIPVISGEIAPDEGVSSILQRYQDRINSRMNARIGEIGQDMVHPADGQESSLGNFITDTMREKTGAQVALLNSGCIRTDLLRGEVKFKDIYSVLPFDSKIVSLEMKGEDLLGVLEDSAGKEKDKKLQVSGLDVVYNSSRLQGQRLISAATEDGQPIDPQKTYTVATIDYLAKGGDQYRGFSRGTPIHSDTGALQMELAKKVVNTRSSLSSAKGRIKDLGA